MKRRILAAALLLSTCALVQAQYSISALDTSYTEDFESYAGYGFTPGGIVSGTLDSTAWVVEGVDFEGARVFSDWGGSIFDPTGASALARGASEYPWMLGGGGVFAATGTPSGTALGVFPEAASIASGWFTVAVRNNTGFSFDSFDVAFDFLAFDLMPNSTLVSYGYSTSLDGGMVTWFGQGLSSGAFSSGSASWGSTSFGDTVSGLNVDDGDVLYFHFAFERFDEVLPVSDPVAIDNLSFTAHSSAVPEPGTYALIFGGLAVVGFIYRRRKQH